MKKCLIALILVLSLPMAPLCEAGVQHPLDSLTYEEHWMVLEVLRQEGRLDENTRFSRVLLAEPDKSYVRGWVPGDPIERSAFAVVRQEERSFEAVVDLVARRIVSWTEIEDAQPMWLSEEEVGMSEIVKQNPEFQKAVETRGMEMIFIECYAWPPGYFGTPEQQGRRVGYVTCEDVRARNAWPREVPGLTVVVDMNEKKVLRVVDEGPVPMASVNADFDQGTIGQPREVPGQVRVDQPGGPGFLIDGQYVEWQGWRFHLRTDPRVGVVISDVTYRDGEEPRSVLYQGYLSEIFVPYMDPAFGWYARNFIDAGEYAYGGLIKPLMRRLDCPDHAIYFDLVVAGDNGRPITVPDTVCLFERVAGDVSWRHWSEHPASRPRRDLVVRSAAVLSNYDYIFDWTFQQTGSIQVGVGATGIVEVKVSPVSTADEQSSTAESADAYGHFIDRNIIGVSHDHYFSFRLDLDVDGPENSFRVDRLVTRTFPEDHPRRSIWVVDSEIAETESAAKMNIDLLKPKLWRIVSAERKNHVGNPTSYQLMPGKNARTLLVPEDYPRRRAGFIDNHLWVTPYAADERYAAGLYPTLSEPGEGLPKWTVANRDIENTDIVVWHTVGMHHFVRTEDWPVMPVLWHTFELRPFDFFDRNPALDLPLRP